MTDATQDTPSESIGFIGLGLIGGAIADISTLIRVIEDGAKVKVREDTP
jgi:hypothetical protein